MTLKTILGIAVISAAALTGTITTLAAQEWRAGEFKRFDHEVHHFGEFCTFRIETRGFAEKRFFGGGGGRKAEARAVQHWESEVARAVGPQFASWARAQGKTLRCEDRGPLNLECIASANPCREHR